MSDIDTKARAAAADVRKSGLMTDYLMQVVEGGWRVEPARIDEVAAIIARHFAPVRRERDEAVTRCEKLERLVRALRRAEGRRSRCEERFDSAIDTRWPAACETAAEELEQARQAVDAARAALFAAVERKGN